MDSRIKELLKPEVLNSVNGLELVARIIVEGFMSGANRSQAVGIGQEFNQYRSYEPGDDLRHIDWKIYARAERYFIKQAEIETNITVKFMVDASRSMAYSENGITKFHRAQVMVGALAYLARKQGDAFGLYTLNDKQVNVIHPRFEQQQFMRFLQGLVDAKPESTWKKKDTEHLFDHHGKELIIFITDLYDDEGDLPYFISRLKTRRNEVVVFHILGKREKNLDFDGTFTFRDLENGTMRKVDTRAESIAYTHRIQSWIKESRINLLEKNIHYYPVSMAEDDMREVLSHFLKSRKNLIS
jgi:uncharacterized protein (DUF58 family)